MYNLEKYSTNSMEIGVGPDKGHNDGCDIEEEGEGGDEEEDNDNEDIRAHQHDGCMFKEAVMDDIDLILDFTAGLKHQVQFFDQWLLNTLEQVGAYFLQFVKACMEKERRMNLMRAPTVSMWEKPTRCSTTQGSQLLMKTHEAAILVKSFPSLQPLHGSTHTNHKAVEHLACNIDHLYIIYFSCNYFVVYYQHHIQAVVYTN